MVRKREVRGSHQGRDEGDHSRDSRRGIQIGAAGRVLSQVRREGNVRSAVGEGLDRKSTRLNSSHGYISYAVFCLKKKRKTQLPTLQCPHAHYHAATQHRNHTLQIKSTFSLCATKRIPTIPPSPLHAHLSITLKSP